MTSENCAPNVILLRGAPAIGKSTAAKGIITTLGHGAVVEVDHFRSIQAACNWHCRHQHNIALSVASDCANAFVANGVTPVVIVDTFGRERLPEMKTKMVKRNLSHIAISLWSDSKSLLDRSRRRGDNEQAHEMSEFMNLEIKSVRYDDETLIDTTEMDPDEVIQAILKVALSFPLATEEIVTNCFEPRHKEVVMP